MPVTSAGNTVFMKQMSSTIGGCVVLTIRKSVLIDDDISVVGSFNIDMRSVYLDTELMLVIDSKEINEQLGGAMQTYEHSARKANADGTYDNPYNVQPVALTPKRERRMKLIKNFLLWTRYLF